MGRIRIEPATRTVRLDGQVVGCTSIEFDILEHLAREAGSVVCREELIASVCGRALSPLDRSLDVHISHLRQKLQRYGRQIVTVRGVGYMLATAPPPDTHSDSS